MPQKNAILAEGLTKRYGDIIAVDHISFQVNEGEIFGFLGPNGSDKTSTIRMLVGLSQPEEGRASVLGYNLPAEISQAKRNMGVVPDVSNLYDELSAQGNLLFLDEPTTGLDAAAARSLRGLISRLREI